LFGRLNQNFVIFIRQITWFRWTNRHWTSGVNVHNKNSIDLCRFKHNAKNSICQVVSKKKRSLNKLLLPCGGHHFYNVTKNPW
jgi:hypothetical protein